MAAATQTQRLWRQPAFMRVWAGRGPGHRPAGFRYLFGHRVILGQVLVFVSFVAWITIAILDIAPLFPS